MSSFGSPPRGQVRQAVASLTLRLLLVVAISLGNPIILPLIVPIVVTMHIRRFFNDVWNLPAAYSGDVTPIAAFRKDVQAQLVQGALLGVVLATPFGLLAGLIAWIEKGSKAGLITGVMILVAVAIVAGASMTLLSGAAPRVLLAEVAFFARGRGVRFMPLLQEALERQVLRQAGAVYQFRHADLQDHLADRYVRSIEAGGQTKLRSPV